MRRIYRLAKQHNVTLGRNRVEEVNRVKKLSAILAKYTAGLGITEIFLSDHHVQDVYIDAPVSQNLVHVVLGGQVDERIAGKCVTNVILSENDAESLLSRLRYESGRPFSEAMPLLECDISGFNTRATVIGAPLSPEGIAFALRRHATEPWTLLRLMSVRSLTPLAAGLLSFLIDGNATMLIAGARSAGKTALLGALMFEFPQSQRIISIEDTRELPCVELQALGYKIQSMVVQSAVGGIGELTANEALKIALRLGESALIIGEVRGEETKTLYEAMRAGTAGSSVLGTFHANSARAVFERVVHDIGIPPKSFNATDVVVVASFTRPSGIQRQIRRVTQIAELKKDAEEEGVFEDLMTYDEAHDMLVETDVFRHTSDKIGEIARSWGLTREDALDNIIARATIRKITVDYALRHNNMKLLSPSWVSKLNTSFWALVERQHRQYGRVDHRLLIEDWKKWFGKNVEYA
jgi:type IV secretory pathway ATPase VirB11/archaellum biosynthesis ATPase